MTRFAIFLQFWFQIKLFQIMNLPALLQNKNTRLGPFPRKRSVLQNPDREKNNQSAGSCPCLNLPYNKYGLLTKLVRSRWLDIWILAKLFFCVFMDFVKVHKHSKKKKKKNACTIRIVTKQLRVKRAKQVFFSFFFSVSRFIHSI